MKNRKVEVTETKKSGLSKEEVLEISQRAVLSAVVNVVAARVVCAAIDGVVDTVKKHKKNKKKGE